MEPNPCKPVRAAMFYTEYTDHMYLSCIYSCCKYLSPATSSPPNPICQTNQLIIQVVLSLFVLNVQSTNPTNQPNFVSTKFLLLVINPFSVLNKNGGKAIESCSHFPHLFVKTQFKLPSPAPTKLHLSVPQFFTFQETPSACSSICCFHWVLSHIIFYFFCFIHIISLFHQIYIIAAFSMPV